MDTDQRIVVPEDPIIREMMADFVESWRRDIRDKLPQLESERKQDELYRFGHTLRGSGRQFGLLRMSDIGLHIQECARAEQWDQLPKLRADLQSELDYVQQFIIDHGFAPADRFRDIPTNL